MNQLIKFILKRKGEINPRNLLRFAGWLTGKFAFIGPHTVLVDIINECDMRCIMCWYHSPLLLTQKDPAWEKDKLSIKTFAALTKDLKQLKTDKVFICGCGEPLLHPDIEEMVSLAARDKLRTSINTNGAYLNKNNIDRLLSYGLNGLDLSIHAADKQTYLAIHPQKDPAIFEQIVSNLQYLSERKRNLKQKFQLTLINVISGLNYETIDKMLELAIRIKAEKIVLKPIKVFKETKHLLSLKKEGIRRIKDILRHFKKLPMLHNIPEFINTIDSNLDDRENKREISWQKNRSCHIPWTRASITTNGRVLSCVYGERKNLGNISKKSFRNIYKGGLYRNYRRHKFCPSLCLAKAVYPFIKTH